MIGTLSEEELSSLLSEEALRRVEVIGNTDLRDRLLQVFRLCAKGLVRLRTWSPKQPELEMPYRRYRTELDVILRGVQAAREFQREMERFFTPQEASSSTQDIEFAFDVLGNAEAYAGSGDLVEKTTNKELKDLGKNYDSTVGGLLFSLGADIRAFEEGLRHASSLGDSWTLYAEYWRFRDRLERCIETTVAMLVHANAGGDLMTLFPSYTNVTAQGIRLRREVALLHRDMERLLEITIKAPPSLVPSMRAALAERVRRFEAHSVYTLVRPYDLRAILEFAAFLAQWGDQDGERSLCEKTEDFTRFIEVMCGGINQREHMRRSDAIVLDGLLRESTGGPANTEDIITSAQTLFGRDPAFDELIARGQVEDLKEHAARLRAAIGPVPEIFDV